MATTLKEVEEFIIAPDGIKRNSDGVADIGVGEGVTGRAAAPLVEQKFATFGQFS